MSVLYPLRFQPVLRRYLWGGRRLGTELRKPIGPGTDYAESWEVVDHGMDQSVVLAGPLAGCTLAELTADHGPALLGQHHPQRRFPLLFKFLDAGAQLSVQVHPDDTAAARLDPPDLGKTEAWIILDAAPGSFLYAGLKPGVDRAALAKAIESGRCEDLLHRAEPRAGECYFLRAGVVHALGSGLLVAEIQQSSDTTYRMYDWNRLGPDGKPRPLHVTQALAVTNYGYGAVAPQSPQPTARADVEQLVACDKFVLDRWRFEKPAPAGGDSRFHILAVLAGAVSLENDPVGKPLLAGDVALLPAAAGPVMLSPLGEAVLLDSYLP